MDQIAAFLSNPTVRRLAVTGLTAAIVAGNKKFNLGLDTMDIGGLVTLALGYLLQSAATDRARIMSDAQAAADAGARGDDHDHRDDPPRRGLVHALLEHRLRGLAGGQPLGDQDGPAVGQQHTVHRGGLAGLHHDGGVCRRVGQRHTTDQGHGDRQGSHVT